MTHHFLGLLGFRPDLCIATGADLAALLSPWCGGAIEAESFEDLAVVHGPARAQVRSSRGGTATAGSLWLGFDGRLGSQGLLREELGIPSQGGACSQARLAVQAWRNWREETPRRLTGDFLIIAYDRQEGQLWLARDHSPLRPLFFVHKPGEYAAFSDLPGPLLDLTGSRAVDDAAMAGIFAGAPISPLATGHRNLQRTPRAHVVKVTSGHVETRRWWAPDFAPPPTGWRDDDYADTARRLLDEAVALYAGHDEKIGLALTGGLDSTAVAESAWRQGIGKLSAYSVLAPGEECVRQPPGRMADQRPQVEAMGRYLEGVPLTILPYHARPGDAASRDRMRRTRLPSLVPHLAGRLEDMLGAMKSDGVTLALGGEGGNQTLSADGMALFHDLGRSGQWGVAALEIAALWRLMGRPAARHAAGMAAPHWLWQSWGALIGRKEPDAPIALQLLRPELRNELATLQDFGERAGEREDPRRQWLEILCRDGAYADALFLPWRIAGIDMGWPLYDRRLIDFALRTPQEQFLRGGVTRWLMRRILDKRVPGEIAWEQRMGYDLSDMPVRGKLWRESLRAEWAHIMHSRAARRLFDMDALSSLMEDEGGGQYDHAVHYHRWRIIADAIATAQVAGIIEGEN